MAYVSRPSRSARSRPAASRPGSSHTGPSHPGSSRPGPSHTNAHCANTFQSGSSHTTSSHTSSSHTSSSHTSSSHTGSSHSHSSRPNSSRTATSNHNSSRTAPSHTGPSRPAMGRRLKSRSASDKRHRQRQASQPEPFPFLVHDHTVSHIRQSKVLFLLRGLPGSGKSTIVTQLRSRYRRSIVCSADDFFLGDDGKTYTFDASRVSDAHAWCQQRATEACEDRRNNVVIIDNTNIKRWEMMFYVKLAARCNYAVVMVSPQTPWRCNAEELARRNKHGVDIATIQKRLKDFLKPVHPIYWAWFFNAKDSQSLLAAGKKYFSLCVAQIRKLERDLRNSAGQFDGELTYSCLYSRSSASTSSLHCTAYFSGDKRAADTQTYATTDTVQRSTGQAFSLAVIGFIITPKTLGARIALNKRQLLLWGNDLEDLSDVFAKLSVDQGPLEKMRSRPKFSPVVGCAERSHVTLGWSQASSAVQTGYDQIEVVRQEETIKDVGSHSVDGGVARYYGDGKCVVYLDQPIRVNGLFSGKY